MSIIVVEFAQPGFETLAHILHIVRQLAVQEVDRPENKKKGKGKKKRSTPHTPLPPPLVESHPSEAKEDLPAPGDDAGCEVEPAEVNTFTTEQRTRIDLQVEQTSTVEVNNWIVVQCSVSFKVFNLLTMILIIILKWLSFRSICFIL